MLTTRSLFATITLVAPMLAFAQTPVGVKPGYLSGTVSRVANQQAITHSVWAPGLDDGYVPQGLAFHQGQLLIAAYQSTDPAVGKGPCRVYSVNPVSGAITGQFDMPSDCTHAGGLTMIDDANLVLSDTHDLYKIELHQALAEKSAVNAIRARVRLKGALKGSFVGFDGRDLWIGSSERDVAKARAYRLSLDVFVSPSAAPLNERKVLSVVSIPTQANGLAFDAAGRMWLTASSSHFGALYRLKPETGEVLQKFDMVTGIEDLAFDAHGALWSVSEAGTRRWSGWRQTYPLAFSLSIDALK